MDHVYACFTIGYYKVGSQNPVFQCGHKFENKQHINLKVDGNEKWRGWERSK
jgi:hypothetical protein